MDHPNEAMTPITPPLPVPALDQPRGGPTPATMTLADFEQMALANNPTLVQAAGVVGVSRGRAWQAGLWPNPLMGYQGEQIGARGRSSLGSAALGEHQAFFVQQEIPSAARQRISRRKYEWEAVTARMDVEIQQLRVLNGVRIHFFQALGSQQLVENRRVMFTIADAALRTTEQMVNDGQANAPDLLSAQVQQQQARILLVHAENQFRKSWVSLVAETGQRGLPPARLEGPLDAGAPPLDFDATLSFIQENSPEIKAATAEIRRDEIVVHRERIQPIPNLFVRADVGPNFETGSTTTSVSIYGNIPVWNKNQGTIYQANSHLEQARANLRRVQLSIEQRLAAQMSDYNSALATVTTYRDETLPRAKKAFELLEQSYLRSRAAWPQVLVAQRTWVQLQAEYIHALVDLRRAEIEIKGMLLTGGLMLPQAPEPLGNINVSPDVR
jgi:cobalt-zinc-cadmium efflux system outer membrane protein